jgi:hypothetical protein
MASPNLTCLSRAATTDSNCSFLENSIRRLFGEDFVLPLLGLQCSPDEPVTILARRESHSRRELSNT